MTITKEKMIAQGFLFNDEGEGYSEHLKDKAISDSFASTGHYHADNAGQVFFWYSDGLGTETLREDFPE